LIYIIIKKEFIQEKKLTIIKNSEEEIFFANDLISRVGNIDITNIHGYETLAKTVKKFASILEELWYIYSRQVYITKYSKAWWNKDCSKNLFLY